MVDLHSEITKTKQSQKNIEADLENLEPTSREVFKSSLDFNKNMISILNVWLQEKDTKVPENKELVTFEKVVDEENKETAQLRAEWKEIVSEALVVKSWACLQTFSSSSLAKAKEKSDLDETVKVGKAHRKDAVAFVRSVKKSCADMENNISKASTKAETDRQAADLDESRGHEAAAVLVAAAAATAPQPVMPAMRSPEVLAFFKQDIKIPEVVSFTVGSVAEMSHGFLKQKYGESALKEFDAPYGVAASAWADNVKVLPSVATAIGKFMGDFLNSEEYKSELGRGNVTVSLEAVGKALRDIVVLPNSPVVPVTRSLLAQPIRIEKQVGPHHNCFCVCACA